MITYPNGNTRRRAGKVTVTAFAQNHSCDLAIVAFVQPPSFPLFSNLMRFIATPASNSVVTDGAFLWGSEY